MSLLTIHHPVADIGGSLDNVASQCDSGYLDPGLGLSQEINEENLDVAAILSAVEKAVNVCLP